MNKRVLAISSGGGHWVQLLRLRPAFSDCDVVYATIHKSSASDVPGSEIYFFSDASRKRPFRFLLVIFQMAIILLRVRPDVIITTGSAPVLFCVAYSRIFGVRSLWIDSIANCDTMSSSGARARRVATNCISQWPKVASRFGIEYWGRVL